MQKLQKNTLQSKRKNTKNVHYWLGYKVRFKYLNQSFGTLMWYSCNTTLLKYRFNETQLKNQIIFIDLNEMNINGVHFKNELIN